MRSGVKARGVKAGPEVEGTRTASASHATEQRRRSGAFRGQNGYFVAETGCRLDKFAIDEVPLGMVTRGGAEERLARRGGRAPTRARPRHERPDADLLP